MDPIYKTDIIKIKNDNHFFSEDTLIREIKLEIILNGDRIGAVMCTPIDQKELAIGYLMSEGIISNIDNISEIRLLNDGMRIEIESEVDKEQLQRLNSEAVVISGCGKSMTANIDPAQINAKIMRDDYHIEPGLLSKQMDQFYTECPLYEQTGCVHTAKLYVGTSLSFVAEDIAQHNTIDKVIGKALQKGVDTSHAFLMVSGRLSSEMVAKTVMHQIPILASRTASTCLGLQIAEKFGLTLVGFVRSGGMNLYRHPHRIAKL